jgi:hypothetical protein
LAGAHRADHHGHVVVNFLDQPGEIGRGQSALAGKMGAADQRRQRARRKAGGAAFDLQIGRRVVRPLRTIRGGLQRAHANLDAIGH